MRSFRELTEAKETVVFGFGRFNPSTIGHEKLIEKVASVAGSNPFFIYPSHTTGPKDPLAHSLKVAWMRKMFPKYKRKIIADKNAKTAIQIAEKLYKDGYKNLIMVAGSDRLKEFETLLNRYNDAPDKKGNQLFKFDSVKVVSAGERDPDAEGVAGMSASKMRAAAEEGDFDSFKTGIPNTLSDDDKKKYYLAVRKGMGIREEREMGDDYDSLRDAYLTGKIWNVGEVVEANGVSGEVVRKGTNYLSFVADDGKVHKAWLHDIVGVKPMSGPTGQIFALKSEEVELDERNYAKEYANYGGRPEQIARRSSRNKARRAMGDKAVKGMDVGHADNNPMNNDPKNLRMEKPSDNRREPRLREEDELDEMSWYKVAIAKISQLNHPKDYEKMLKQYMSDMKKPELKNKTASYIAARIANDYKGQDGRKLVQYINKLVDDGKLPKELKAEYQEEKTMQTFSDLVKQINEVKQDKDVDDKKGTQPAKYYAGDMSKSTKNKRDAHFRKKKSGPAPGDADAKTKPSVHTKKFKQMFGEVLPDSASQKDYIDDFEKSDAPQFQGKSKEKRREMAIAAYLSKNEDAPCWDSHKQVGMKKKSGRMVPNCVPKNEEPRIPRKKGQPAGSDKHSDLYTDENPKGTIQGLGFKDVDTAKASVKKIIGSGKPHAHKIQAAIAMEQRAKEMGKTSEASVYRTYIDKMKKKTKEMQEEVELNEWGEVTEKDDKSGKELNNPTKGDVKKYKVYVKNDKGNVVKVEFGDPNMSIKRDDPARRKAFRARHNCDQKKDKTTAGYWSCKFWSTKSVTDLMKG